MSLLILNLYIVIISQSNELKLTYLNSTHASCLVPPSLFIQSVLLKIVSTDIDILISTNIPKDFTFMTDYELLSLNSEYFILR